MTDFGVTRQNQANFERLVARLMEANGFAVEEYPREALSVRGFDFVARLSNLAYLVEVKYYRTSRAQVALIETAAARLKSALGRQAERRRGMLVVSSHVPGELRASLERAFGLVLVDRTDLFNWAAKARELTDELHAILEDDDGSVKSSSSGRSATDIIVLDLGVGIPLQPDTEGTNLCNELRRLKPGKSTWAAYEKLCERILKYLFPNDLLGWHSQKRTDDDLNRFDYVCRIRPVTDFWAFLIHHLDSRYALFEFKNYTGQIKQGQVLTTEKYLLEKGLRRVAVIFSRKGFSKEALRMAQGAMRESGKLMLALDDDKVCAMLHMKERGEDPTDLLFDLADEFLLSLPR